jgi:hypothetical protein
MVRMERSLAHDGVAYGVVLVAFNDPPVHFVATPHGVDTHSGWLFFATAPEGDHGQQSRG